MFCVACPQFLIGSAKTPTIKLTGCLNFNSSLARTLFGRHIHKHLFCTVPLAPRLNEFSSFCRDRGAQGAFIVQRSLQLTQHAVYGFALGAPEAYGIG